MKRTAKLDVFFEIAKRLNLVFNARPVLYGSLGLSQLVDAMIDVDDIDILIEAQLFDASLQRVKAMMAQLGFRLVDEAENEFVRNDIKVGIASDGDMKTFAHIDPLTLRAIETPAKARLLDLEQYLACYTASMEDGYRKIVRQKNDALKIEIIKRQLDRGVV